MRLPALAVLAVGAGMVALTGCQPKDIPGQSTVNAAKSQSACASLQNYLPQLEKTLNRVTQNPKDRSNQSQLKHQTVLLKFVHAMAGGEVGEGTDQLNQSVTALLAAAKSGKPEAVKAAVADVRVNAKKLTTNCNEITQPKH